MYFVWHFYGFSDMKHATLHFYPEAITTYWEHKLLDFVWCTVGSTKRSRVTCKPFWSGLCNPCGQQRDRLMTCCEQGTMGLLWILPSNTASKPVRHSHPYWAQKSQFVIVSPPALNPSFNSQGLVISCLWWRFTKQFGSGFIWFSVVSSLEVHPCVAVTVWGGCWFDIV